MAKIVLSRLTDYEKVFSDTIGARILNSADLTSKQIVDDYISKMFYLTDTNIGFVASCECQEYRGNHYQGHVCPYCGTMVSTQFAKNLTSTNWIGIPDCMPKVIHPVFYSVLKTWLGTARYKHDTDTKAKLKGRKIALIDAILDPSEELPYDVQAGIKGQGFSYFNEHVDEIMDFLLHTYKGPKMTVHALRVEKMYEMYKSLFFVDKLPILHPSMHPLAREGRTRSADSSAFCILPAIIDLHTASFATRRCVTSKHYADKELWKIYSKYLQYLETIIVKKIGNKYALIRRHVIGARMQFSGRTVIVPIVTKHMGDELYFPWKVGVNILKYEILNVLMNRQHFDYTSAINKFMRALVVYDEDICAIMQTLIRECPIVSPSGKRGLPVICGRNPTLQHGGEQLFYIPRIKKNVHDQTFGFPPLACRAPGADFDGDEMYIQVIKEMSMVPHLMALHPMETILSVNDISVSSTVAPTVESLVHITSFLASGDNTPDDCMFEL